MSDEVIGKIEELGVFPIIVLDDPRKAVKLGEALLEGGMPSAEVTFRTDAAEEAIRELSVRFPEMLVGAGTVLSREQAKRAVGAGARYILAPGFNPEVVEFCLGSGVAVFPGVCTPTDMETAMRAGLRVVKFFPAEAIGGLAYLKSVSGPLSMIRYLPTGGINTKNLADYLRFDRVVGCAGTWIARRDWIASGKFERIREEAAAAVKIVHSVRKELSHG